MFRNINRNKFKISKRPGESVKINDTIMEVGHGSVHIYDEDLQSSLEYRYSNAFVINKEVFNRLIGWYLGTCVVSEDASKLKESKV